MSFDRSREHGQNLKIAVIGGTGFIGYHIVNDLILRNYDVTIMTRNPPRHIPTEWKEHVTFSKLDSQKATEEEFKIAFTGHQGLIFAAGGDPGDKEFREKNVDAVKRIMIGARNAGCDRAVVLGSYFTYFTNNGSKFANDFKKKHSYVGSRIEQARVAREFGGSAMAVSVIEIPWVFGATPGRVSLWKGLVNWTHSRLPLFAPDGGTAAVSVETVARVAAAALQTRSDRTIPVAEGNFTWRELLNKIAPKQRTVYRIPTPVMRFIGLMGNVFNFVTRQPDTGLTPGHFLGEVFTRKLFIDLDQCRELEKQLGLPRDINEATMRMNASFAATIKSCFPSANQTSLASVKPLRSRKNWIINNIPESKETTIITGANSGIGFELAKTLAAKGFHVIMACRNVRNGDQARERILRIYPKARISVEVLDLADFSSIRNFSLRISALYKEISLLVNNAGIIDVPYSKTVDGNEVVFQTNYLGHFMLTALLFPLLEAAKSPRIVTVSSYAASKGQIDISQLQADEKHYDEFKVYANSKLANLMFARELHRRLRNDGSHVISVSAHPGFTNTNILNHSHTAIKTCFYRLGNTLLAQDVSKGIIPIAYACVAADVKSGEYYGPDGKLSELSGDHPKLVTMHKQVMDEKMGAQLWEASEHLTKTKLMITHKPFAGLEHRESETKSKEQTEESTLFDRLSDQSTFIRRAGFFATGAAIGAVGSVSVLGSAISLTAAGEVASHLARKCRS